MRVGLGSARILAVLSGCALPSAPPATAPRPTPPVAGSTPEREGAPLPPAPLEIDLEGGPPSSEAPPRSRATVPPPGTAPTLHVDAGCVDGQVREALPTPTVDISDLVAAYRREDARGFVDAVLARRWPWGTTLTAGTFKSGVSCVLGPSYRLESAAEALEEMDTIAHECGHNVDRAGSRYTADGQQLYVNGPGAIRTIRGDMRAWRGDTFARGRIRDDAFASVFPACRAQQYTGCDSFAELYLGGDLDDDVMDLGDQSFGTLLEEAVQYINDLATAWAVLDPARTSSTNNRDGVLAMLWYVERYLALARTRYPDTYRVLTTSDDGAWRDAILEVWGRAWLYLEHTAGLPQLGIDDDALERAVLTPALLDEIERLRAAAGC